MRDSIKTVLASPVVAALIIGIALLVAVDDLRMTVRHDGGVRAGLDGSVQVTSPGYIQLKIPKTEVSVSGSLITR